jgi:prepilin-type N-terminal cleavage/methylation domain-containing protein
LKIFKKIPEQARGFVLVELLIAMVIASLMMSLVALLIGNMTQVLMRLKEKVDSFDRASQVFLWLHQEINQSHQDFGDKNFSIRMTLSPDQAIFYPLQNALQFLTQPPDFFPILKSEAGQYAGGLLIWSVHFLSPLREVSGKKGDNFLAYTQTRNSSYGYQAFDKNDVVGVREGQSIQISKISRVSSSGIFLTKPLSLNIKNGQCGLLTSDLWYIGYTAGGIGKNNNKNKALYRYQSQNHLKEKIVSDISAFGLTPQNPGKIWVQQGSSRYVF